MSISMFFITLHIYLFNQLLEIELENKSIFTVSGSSLVAVYRQCSLCAALYIT